MKFPERSDPVTLRVRQRAAKHILQRGYCVAAGGAEVTPSAMHPGQQAGGEQVSGAGEGGWQTRNVHPYTARAVPCGAPDQSRSCQAGASPLRRPCNRPFYLAITANADLDAIICDLTYILRNPPEIVMPCYHIATEENTRATMKTSMKTFHQLASKAGAARPGADWAAGGSLTSHGAGQADQGVLRAKLCTGQHHGADAKPVQLVHHPHSVRLAGDLVCRQQPACTAPSSLAACSASAPSAHCIMHPFHMQYFPVEQFVGFDKATTAINKTIKR